MKFLWAFFVIFSSQISLAAGTKDLLIGVGDVYVRQTGPCADFVDVMPWENYETTGLVSFAQTNTPGVRPLEGYVRSISIDASQLRPLGEGVFVTVMNQPIPVRAEYILTMDGISLYVLNKGKSSFGFFDSKNERYVFAFSDKNADGIYSKLTTTWQNLKGLFNSKKQTCNFTLQP